MASPVVRETLLQGKPCGYSAWSPWGVEITDALRTGENSLDIIVTNSLYNLIYGSPRPSGLLGQVVVAWKED